MELREYVKLALRTESHEHYLKISNKYAVHGRVFHGLVGIKSEYGELLSALKKEVYGVGIDTVNIGEEIGDIQWFIAILLDYLDETKYFSSDFIYSNLSDTSNLIQSYNDIIELAPKTTNVNEASRSAVKLLREVHEWNSYCLGTCQFLGLDINKVREANISKLKNRYPDKYTDERASNRDLTKERNGLEKDIN